MKRLFVLAAASVAALTTATSCGLAGAKLTTDVDTLAYAIGVDLGNMVFQFDSTLNVDIVAAALKDVYAKRSQLTREQAGAFIQEYMTVGLARKNAAAGQEFIEKAVKNGAQTLPSGLAYKIDNPGSDKKIALGDSIYVKYTLTLPNGQELERATEAVPMLLQKSRLIEGWIEGLPLVGEGGQITLFLPGDLAYGEMGTPGGIGPNQALQFDIEVTKVVPGEQPAEE